MGRHLPRLPGLPRLLRAVARPAQIRRITLTRAQIDDEAHMSGMTMGDEAMMRPGVFPLPGQGSAVSQKIGRAASFNEVVMDKDGQGGPGSAQRLADDGKPVGDAQDGRYAVDDAAGHESTWENLRQTADFPQVQ